MLALIRGIGMAFFWGFLILSFLSLAGCDRAYPHLGNPQAYNAAVSGTFEHRMQTELYDAARKYNRAK